MRVAAPPVLVQRRLLSEAERAQLAAERPLARVRLHVVLQLRARHEPRRAHLAQVVGLPVLAAHVLRVVGVVRERLAADFADAARPREVQSPVARQAGRRAHLGAADVAHEQRARAVHEQVFGEVVALPERAVTLGAAVGPAARVDQQVRVQRSLVVGRVVALVAPVTALATDMAVLPLHVLAEDARPHAGVAAVLTVEHATWAAETPRISGMLLPHPMKEVQGVPVCLHSR